MIQLTIYTTIFVVSEPGPRIPPVSDVAIFVSWGDCYFLEELVILSWVLVKYDYLIYFQMKDTTNWLSINGVHLSHSRKVAHVYYQLFDSKMADGDQLGGQCQSSNMIYAGMHRQTFEKLTWLKGTYYTENPSIRFMFVTFQYYYCICWMSKLPRLKIKHH